MLHTLKFIDLIKFLSIIMNNTLQALCDATCRDLNWNDCTLELRWQRGVEALAKCSPQEFQPCELFALFPEWTSMYTHKVLGDMQLCFVLLYTKY